MVDCSVQLSNPMIDLGLAIWAEQGENENKYHMILEETIQLKSYLNHSLVDNVGACVSFACALHCMATPLLIIALPLIGLGFLLSESVELVIIVVAVGLALGSLTWGYWHHRKWRIFLILGGAFVCIFIARFQVPEQYESIFTASGGILLMAGHLLNRRLCRACQHCKTLEG